MLSNLYSLLTFTFTPFFYGVLKLRLKRGKEHPVRFKERMGRAGQARPEGRVLWFHGASVGEAISILPLIEDALHEYPDSHILVTTGTVTSARLMEDRLPERAVHQFIPMDSPLWVGRFFDHWSPDAVIWLESDFWPNILKQIKQRGIPAILVNARMSVTSFKKWQRWGAGFIKSLLSVFDVCLAQNDAEKQRLEAFGHENVHVTSNLKYASPPLPALKGKVEALNTLINGRTVWQFASTHPGEEEQAADVHAALKGQFPDILTIIIPRHPERGGAIRKMLEARGLRVAQRSANEPIKAGTDIYLADTLGEMGVFFKTVTTVVMGGSFVPHGGHNPIEPAQFGCCIIYGPHMFNFKTICYDFETHDACFVAQDSIDLANMLKRTLSNKDDAHKKAASAKKMVENKSFARKEVWSYIDAMVKKTSVKKNDKEDAG